jgi:hypothetical protein
MKKDRRNFIGRMVGGTGAAVLIAGGFATGISAQSRNEANKDNNENAPIAPPASGNLLIVRGDYHFDPSQKELVLRHLPDNTERTLLSLGEKDVREVHAQRMHSKVAVEYASEEEIGKGNIAIIDTATGETVNEQLFPENKFLQEEMSWSADGKYLTYTEYLPGGDQRIAIIDVVSGEKKFLPFTGTVFASQFHPTDRNILLLNTYDDDMAAFMSDEELAKQGMSPEDIKSARAKIEERKSVQSTQADSPYPQIVTYNISTGETSLVGEGSYGNWSPDGTKIACNFRIVNSNTGFETRIWDATKENALFHTIPFSGGPQWSTDSKTLSCMSSRFDGGQFPTQSVVTLVDMETKLSIESTQAFRDGASSVWIDANWLAVTTDWDHTGLPSTRILNRDIYNVANYPQPSAPKEKFEKAQGFLPDLSHTRLPYI